MVPAVFMVLVVSMMRKPRPPMEAMNSATVAATSAWGMAIRKPAIIHGLALGSVTFQKSCQRDAPSTRATFRNSRSPERIPS